MSITLRASTNSNSGTQGTHSVTKPTGTLTGDTLFWYLSFTSSSVITAMPPGFVLIGTLSSGTANTYLYRKLALSDEPSSYNVNWSGAGNISTYLSSFYSSGNVPIVVDDIQTSINASSTNRLFPSVTTTAANDYFMAYGTLGSNQVSTPDALMAELNDVSQAPKIYVMSQTVAGIGATGTRTATGTASTSYTISMALKEGTTPANAVYASEAGLYVEAIPTTEVDVTQTGLYVEAIPTAEVRATQYGVYAETRPVPEVRVTQYGVYAETQFNVAFTGILPPDVSITPVKSYQNNVILTIHATSYLGHKIERSLNGVSGWTQIGTTGIGVTTFNDTGRLPVTQYYYRARAYDAVNDGVYSNIASGTTLSTVVLRGTHVPTATLGGITFNKPVGTVSGDLMLVHFTAVNTNVGQVYVAPSGWIFLADSDPGVSENGRAYYKIAGGSEPSSYTFTGQAGFTYLGGIITWYQEDGLALAIDDVQHAIYTSIDRTMPSVTATNLGTMFNGFVSLSSNLSSSPDIGMTEHWDYAAGTTATYVGSVPIADIGATGTKRATGATSATMRSISVLVRTLGTLPVIALFPVATVLTSESIKIDWLEMQASINTGYVIERSLNGVSGWVDVGTVGSSTFTFTDTGLTPLTTYYYRVRGYIISDRSNPTSVVNGTTLYPIRLRTTPTLVSDTNTSITVTTPVGVQLNDLMLMSIHNNPGAIPLPTVPAGWVLLTNKATMLSDDIRVYYKYATGSEPSTFNVAFNTAVDAFYVGMEAWFTDGDIVTIDDIDWATYASTTDRNTPVTNAKTTLQIVNSFHSGTVNANSTPQSGWTEYWDTGNATRAYGTSYQQLTTGATPTLVGTSASAAIVNAVTVLLRKKGLLPEIPIVVAVASTIYHTVIITWDEIDVDNDGYIVERSLDGLTGWTQIGDVAQGVKTFTDTGRTPATTYYYRVTGYIGATYSNSSRVVSVTTVYRVRTRGLLWQNINGTIGTTINKPTDVIEGDLMYVALHTLSSQTTVPPVGWTLVSGTLTSVGNALKVFYKYATNAEPSSYTFGWVGVQSGGIGIVALYDPELLTLVIGDDDTASYTTSTDRQAPAVTSTEPYSLANFFIVSTGANNATPVAGIVERWDNNFSSGWNDYYATKQLPVPATTPTTIATGTTAPNLSYSFIVYPNLLDPVPDVPTLLNATTINDVSIEVTWQDNADDETEYRVERSLDNVTWSQIAVVPADTEVFYSLALTGSTLYYYRVRAWNVNGFSAYSNVDSATTSAPRIYYKYSNVATATTLPS